MTHLWRIHIRPDGDPVAAYSFCLREGVIGVGFQVEHDTASPLSIDDYLKLGADTFGDKWSNGRSMVELLTKMKLGDLVWTRSPRGVYHLCKIIGPWEYRDQPEYREVDVVNIRPVDIVQIGSRPNSRHAPQATA